MKLFCAILLATSLAACSGAVPAATQPSPAFEVLRAQFEREILAMESNYSNGDELTQAAAPVAARIYGARWDLVRAEAQRTLAALPEIDLAPYRRLTSSPPAFIDQGLQQQMLEARDQPGVLAAMRLYDANIVAFSVGAASVNIREAGDPISMIGAKMALVGPRVYRGRAGINQVLALRYYRNMVVIPYAISTEGMIWPDYQHVAVYPLIR